MKKIILFAILPLLFLVGITPLAHSQNIMFMTSIYALPTPCPNCMDNFAGANGTILTTHSGLWQDVDTLYLAHCAALTGDPGVTAQDRCNSDVGGGVYSSSLSDISQVTLKANVLSTFFPVVCVRCGNGSRGYAVGVSLNADGAVNGCLFYKNGGSPQGTSLSIPAGDTKIAIVVSGISTVTIHCYLNGVDSGSWLDTTDTILPSSSGHPGFLVQEPFVYTAWGDWLY